MRLLFIGDVFGRSGRDALKQHLRYLRTELEPDMVVVNGENAANGAGITDKICQEFLKQGVDCITTGNHIWDQRQIITYIDKEPRLLRPSNYPEGTPGNALLEITLDSGHKSLIINIMGTLFMNDLDDPFKGIDDIFKRYKLGRNVNSIFVDFHAEATSEKMAFAHYVDGRVSAVVGTHTHIPTADCQVLPGGTAYQTDAGMTGDYDSVIGVEKDIPILRFTKKMPTERFKPASGEATICGTLIDIDGKTGKARSIKPVRYGGRLSEEIPA